MQISKSYNKNTGITYVYEVLENHWDPVKKRGVPKKKLIGKIDPITGEIVPTGKRGRPRKNAEQIESEMKDSDKSTVSYDQLLKDATATIRAKDQEIKDLKEKLKILENAHKSVKAKLEGIVKELNSEFSKTDY